MIFMTAIATTMHLERIKRIMKTLVVYTSQTGFTKKYAQWMAERMDADLFDLKDVQKNADSSFDEYESIVYGIIRRSFL